MSSTVTKDVSLKNRLLAALVAGGLMLAASGPTLAAENSIQNAGLDAPIPLGSESSVIRGAADVEVWNSTLGVGVVTPIALGSKPGLLSGGSNRGV